MHLRWPVNMGPKNDSFNLGDNPQLSLSSQPCCFRLFSLFCRHVTVIESDPAEGDFLTMHVYAGTQGKRVYYPDTPMFKGIYTNNPHTLVRYD
ncbi:unnamed protein product, partial [Ectocarpus sp. 8 AP-2014]